MKKKLCLYVLGMIVFVSWLILGTSIISSCYNKFKVKRIDFAEYAPFMYQDPVYASVYGSNNYVFDYILYKNDWLQRIVVNGWALVETNQDNGDRKVALILDSDKTDYALFPSITLRDDVWQDLPVILDRKINIPTKYVGYADEFSLLCVDDGIYDLYVYCYENDTNYGMTDTEYQVEKIGNDFQVVKWKSERLDELPAVTSLNSTVGSIENIAIDSDDLIVINGWEIIEGQEDAEKLIYLELVDSNGNILQYSTKNRVRKDLAEFYDNSAYMDSGWRAVIPSSDLTDGIYQLKVLSESKENVWQSKKYTFLKRESDIQLIWISEEVPSDEDTTMQRADAIFNVDGMTVNEAGLISMWGWTFVEGEDSADQTVYIEFENGYGDIHQYTTKKMDRQDVAEYYDNALYKQSGWNAVVSAAELEDDLYRLRVLVKNGENEWSSKPYVVEKDSEGISTVWTSEELSEVAVSTLGKEITSSIDGMTGDNGLISLWGWSFAEDKDCSSQTVYIEFEDEENHIKQFTTKGMVRKDIAEYYGNLLYKQSGWNAVIPTAELKDGIYRLRIIVKNEDDVWASKSCVVEKDSTGIRTLWLSEKLGEIVEATREEEITGSFDGIKTGDNGLISLWGWGFAENQDCSSQTVCIEFTDEENHIKQFTTKVMVREDIAEYYGNSLYKQSGWNAVVPEAELEDGIYRLRMLVKNEENVWSSKPSVIEKKSTEISTVWLSEEKSEVVEATRSEKITGSFDGITTNDNGLISLWGWGFAENQDCSSQTVYIEFTDGEKQIKQYTTNKMVREDVAEYYGNLLYEQSGWNAVIPTVELIDGSYTVRIVIENGEDVWKSEPLAIEKSDDDIIVH